MGFEKSDQTVIVERLTEVLSSIPAVKHVHNKRVRVNIEDWHDYELPAIQIYDAGDSAKHDRDYLTVDWLLNLELILKTTQRGVVDQTTLYDFRKSVIRSIWNSRKLGLSQISSIEYRKNQTGLHVLEPYYWSTLQIMIRYREKIS